MAKSLVVAADTNLLLPVRNTRIKAIVLCAAAANSVVEIWDGATVGAGQSVAKLACVPNTSVSFYGDIDTIAGISVDMTGAAAKAYIIYE